MDLESTGGQALLKCMCGSRGGEEVGVPRSPLLPGPQAEPHSHPARAPLSPSPYLLGHEGCLQHAGVREMELPPHPSSEQGVRDPAAQGAQAEPTR